jgi:hypothetical protein
MKPSWVSKPTRVLAGQACWSPLVLRCSLSFSGDIWYAGFPLDFRCSSLILTGKSREPRKRKKKKKESTETHCPGLRPAVGQQTHAVHCPPWVSSSWPEASLGHQIHGFTGPKPYFFSSPPMRREMENRREELASSWRERWCTEEV